MCGCRGAAAGGTVGIVAACVARPYVRHDCGMTVRLGARLVNGNVRVGTMDEAMTPNDKAWKKWADSEIDGTVYDNLLPVLRLAFDAGTQHGIEYANDQLSDDLSKLEQVEAEAKSAKERMWETGHENERLALKLDACQKDIQSLKANIQMIRANAFAAINPANWQACDDSDAARLQHFEGTLHGIANHHTDLRILETVFAEHQSKLDKSETLLEIATENANAFKVKYETLQSTDGGLCGRLSKRCGSRQSLG